MTTIQAAERETYEEMHCVSQYTEFSPGEKYLPLFLNMSSARSGSESAVGQSVLDVGCSSGKGALALEKAGFDVAVMDLTDSGLVADARRFRFYQQCIWDDFRLSQGYDWVYCCDVLEHIPPEFTMLVISRLLEAATKGVFLSICLIPDNFGAWVGKPLHRTVQDYKWWHDHLSELGEVVEARDLLTNGIYLVRAKQ